MNTPIDDNLPDSHPSYGLISASRFSSLQQSFFGSPIVHHGGVAITITEAKLTEYEGKGAFRKPFQGNHIIRVEMSSEQFARLITDMNVGTGTPCTIVNNRTGPLVKVEQLHNHTAEISKRLKQRVRAAAIEIVGLLKRTRETVEAIQKKPTVTKGDVATIHSMVDEAHRELGSNLPWIYEQYGESINEIRNATISEVVAVTDSVLRQVGLGAVSGHDVALSLVQQTMPQLALESDAVEPQEN